MPLEEIIIEMIRKRGLISFRDFMEAALYYPGKGYYTSPGNKIGPNGDYYTSPCLGNFLGNVLAIQIEEVWELLGRKDITVIEYGAGNGWLCNDILHQLEHNRSCYEGLKYVIIEKSCQLRSRQQQLVHGPVHWHDNISACGAFDGIVFANEVLDNFAVHRVVMQDELMEVFVDYEGGFKETLLPAAPQLSEYLETLGVQLPYGYRAEINLEAKDWIKDMACLTGKFVVLILDYGSGSGELYSPQRKSGTLLCYRQHHRNENYFSDPGQQDITAHVNFSALKYFGELYGLQFGGFTTQAQFLLSGGLSKQLCTGPDTQAATTGQLRMLQSLLMDMGRKIKVMALQKGITSPITGMRFNVPLV